ENVSVNKAQLTVNTKVHDSGHNDVTDSSVALNAIGHGTAKLSGVVAGKTPAAITFAFYSEKDCGGTAAAVANTGADEGDATADRIGRASGREGGAFSVKAGVAEKDK